MTHGDVFVLTGKQRESRKGAKVAQLDNQGYFTITLKDSANTHFFIDCGLEGHVSKTVSYQDTLIQFSISVVCTDYNSDRAKYDIQKNKLCFYYNGSMSDLTESISDSIFSKKYGVRYHVFTDEPQWIDCLREYNNEIKLHLDKIHGESWRKDVRPIILALY